MMRINNVKLVILIYGFVLLNVKMLRANEKNYFRMPGIGIEVGSWKPNKLKKEATILPFGVNGAAPFCRLFFNSPQWGDWTLRCACGYWAQTNIETLPNVGSITLLLFMFDLKQWIIPQSRLTPFVSYGLSIFVGNENESKKNYRPLGKNKEGGYGANVGAGFDLLLVKHWVLTVEFCYHYVRFNRNIGLTSDYSGPKISAGFYYSF